MDQYKEVVMVMSPIYIVIAGVAGLAVVFFALGWLACCALGVRRRIEDFENNAAYAPDVAREVRRLEGRINEHLEQEHAGPLSVRSPRPVRA